MGFVYVLSNTSIPGMVKIGRTAGSVERRANELASTGVPTPFVVECKFQVYDSQSIEQRVHHLLHQYRVNTGREFFACDVTIASHAVLDAIKEVGDQLGPKTVHHITPEESAKRETERKAAEDHLQQQYRLNAKRIYAERKIIYERFGYQFVVDEHGEEISYANKKHPDFSKAVNDRNLHRALNSIT